MDSVGRFGIFELLLIVVPVARLDVKAVMRASSGQSGSL
jgi:hypothetical protein